MLPEITQHMDIVRTHMRGLRELCIAREVSRSSSGKVICPKRRFHDYEEVIYHARGRLSSLLHACVELER